MKRLIAAGVLLVFVAISYFSADIYINKTLKTLGNKLDSCIEVYKLEGSAKAQSENLKKYWKAKEKTLSFCVNHAALDEIELAINDLYTYSQVTDSVYFFERSDRINTLFTQLKEDTDFGIHSIV